MAIYILQRCHQHLRMFRDFRPLIRNATTLRSLSSRNFHTTALLKMVRIMLLGLVCMVLIRTSRAQPGPFVPEDWQIIETSPGGVDKDFVNPKTGEQTWYTPEGATAEEILRVPGATKYFSSESDVEEYIKKMAKQKADNGGKDIKDS
jgi:hypothetical protein